MSDGTDSVPSVSTGISIRIKLVRFGLRIAGLLAISNHVPGGLS